ncbi:PLD nuclease N-terminal domain-containing protein [Agromyces sp. LHK192]|uniref:PLD nuclease N-terminal domain-containing protein n=1 Tax=Agromyces sp. LHK192 TaxID=2498704 RepID=UPI000FD7B76F|nr:PLD nuclease N-terminal domain-containing protein [Agromyces sp. LHK192]
MLVRLAIPAAVVIIGLMVYAIVDCALFDRTRIRGLRRGWWIVVILIPVLGAILWFTIGRGPRLTSPRAGRRSGPVAPDDDTEFLQRLGRDAEQDERIRRLEQELADLDGEGGSPGDDHPDHGAAHDQRRPDAPDNPDAGTSGRPNG